MSRGAQALSVRFCGSNKNADYYKVNGGYNVLHNVKGAPLTCLDCPSNTCEHCKAVAAHLDEHGVAA
jgi:hypothetical protein